MKPLFKTRYTTRQTTMTHKHLKSTFPCPEYAAVFMVYLLCDSLDISKFHHLDIGGLGVGILIIRDLSDSRNGFDRGLLFEVLLAMF